MVGGVNGYDLRVQEIVSPKLCKMTITMLISREYLWRKLRDTNLLTTNKITLVLNHVQIH